VVELEFLEGTYFLMEQVVGEEQFLESALTLVLMVLMAL
jgi:hypothetical protein